MLRRAVRVKKTRRSDARKGQARQSSRELHNCVARRTFPRVPEGPAAAWGLLSLSAVALASARVPAIIVVCAVGFCCLVFLTLSNWHRSGSEPGAAFISPDPGDKGGEEDGLASWAAVRVKRSRSSKDAAVRYPEPPGLWLISHVSKRKAVPKGFCGVAEASSAESS